MYSDNEINKVLRRKYLSMIQRCHNPKSSGYVKYGAKGTRVCDEWLNNYEKFKEWALSTGYKLGMTIDRIDNTKGYSPDNCRWATNIEQANNRTTNINITYKNKTMTLKQWCHELNLKYNTIFARYQMGYTGDELFYNGDVKEICKIRTCQFSLTLNGVTKLGSEWADELRIPYKLVKLRYDKGLSDKEILSTKSLLVERDKNSIKYNGTIEDDLKIGRIDKGLTMRKLSHQLGYKGNQVWRWEKGERKIKKNDIKKLVDLGILDSKWNTLEQE